MSFNSKKTATLSVVAAALLATCWGAQAAAGNTAVITVTASVVSNTCTLDTPSATVALGRLSLNQFTSVDSESSAKPFKLTLSKCGAGATGVKVSATGTEDATDNDLFKNTGAAKGFGIKIMGGDKLTKQLSKSSGLGEYPITKPTGTTDLNLNASVVQTEAAVTAGDVTSSINLEVTYD
ncbi:fimbrial protein [Serratia sp. M24T3]|uniref:fimbrial protein n=1 Tax=Serratia sp. M24T3 TaxID=932213 RepID=UPI00025BB3F2|nr:fimbrial protein [Serratia sp. M24T3]EIC85708.1 fimbrial protein BcfF [Serratia sp. M24T3]